MNKDYHKEYYLKNKEKIKATALQWQRDNPEKFIENVRRWQRKNPAKVLHLAAEQRALKKDLEFSISPEDILIPEVCPYLGMPLVFSRGSGRSKHSPSLDRVDNSKGYIKGNVQVISDMANRMKQDATVEQLLTFARNVIKLHGGTEPTKTTAE